ncbi:hypothetical protein FRZ67_19215 [Panacibacter ginsenosidivorans]|uniref:Uncharacterized protein n=1 Tax=Panacibacter ginsenosidivorans TaxID=1813871 RepID=A0A5B8VCZ1_9BACT|nr:hypothetical protein [Panacibacter ginsenosidivorans]QEC69334.1 hypothetical protein FRZ67_19215 [Panacibacter ginsenosidivorans]
MSKALNVLKNLIYIPIGITLIGMICYGIFYFIGSLYIGGRLAYIGTDKTIIVDSVWYTLEKIDPGKPSVKVNHIRFKNFTGSVSNLPPKLNLGDSVQILYYQKFNEGLTIEHTNKFIQIVDGLGGFIMAFVLASLMFIAFFVPFIYHTIEEFHFVKTAIAKSYQKPEFKSEQILETHKFLSYSIRFLPSILSVFINVLVLLVFLKTLLFVEKANEALCGVLVISILIYFAFISPKWVKWLYLLRYSNHWFLEALRIIVETVIGLKLIGELLFLFKKEDYYFGSLFDLFKETAVKLFDYLFG